MDIKEDQTHSDLEETKRHEGKLSPQNKGESILHPSAQLHDTARKTCGEKPLASRAARVSECDGECDDALQLEAIEHKIAVDKAKARGSEQDERRAKGEAEPAADRAYHPEAAEMPQRSPWKRFKNWIITSPTRTITIGFALTILTGGLLLCLPFASQGGQWTHPVIALFTSTSATCVTGLVVVDTATYWSHFGQFVIVALIQIGGLGIVTIMSFFMMAARMKVNFKTLLAMQESTGSESFVDVKSLVRKIFSITFAVEFIGGSLLFWRYSQYMPLLSAARRAYFQSVSAFCNAGFDLMGDIRGQFTNLMSWNNEPIVLLATASLIIIGGLGFVVWTDLLAFPKRRKLYFHSKIVLSATAILLLSGTVFFAFLEWNNMKPFSMGTLPDWQKPVAAFFQSTTLRTAGFNSIDQIALTQPSKVIAILLMFIGAGPASTGGGIKNTTFVVIAAAAASFLRGKKNAVLGRHKLNSEIFVKAFVIMSLGMTIIGISSFLLLIFEHAQVLAQRFDFIDLMFECTSAFATVGNSTTPTVSMSMASWITLIPCMYLGRVGPASFAMGFSFKLPGSVEKVYPDGKTFVG